MYTHVYTCIFMYTHCALHCIYDLHAGRASCCALASALWVAVAVLSAWRLTQMGKEPRAGVVVKAPS